ncbi:hypothetical protein P7K49_018788 [Saguinus oedipus]|uniref:Uncharacterized protein n=1 Tax=Saguinus oedipus TaxID=9490 RepID=A0ABQ9V936_SAGOE|nr:hypothetical protein P7K49_018788 [Saguinus oedipus]
MGAKEAGREVGPGPPGLRLAWARPARAGGPGRTEFPAPPSPPPSSPGEVQGHRGKRATRGPRSSRMPGDAAGREPARPSVPAAAPRFSRPAPFGAAGARGPGSAGLGQWLRPAPASSGAAPWRRQKDARPRAGEDRERRGGAFGAGELPGTSHQEPGAGSTRGCAVRRGGLRAPPGGPAGEAARRGEARRLWLRGARLRCLPRTQGAPSGVCALQPGGCQGLEAPMGGVWARRGLGFVTVEPAGADSADFTPTVRPSARKRVPAAAVIGCRSGQHGDWVKDPASAALARAARTVIGRRSSRRADWTLDTARAAIGCRSQPRR